LVKWFKLEIDLNRIYVINGNYKGDQEIGKEEIRCIFEKSAEFNELLQLLSF
jgi:hypothetical protein